MAISVAAPCVVTLAAESLRMWIAEEWSWDPYRGQRKPPINQPFIVLTETKFSYRYIPVWARYSPHRTSHVSAGEGGASVTGAGCR